MEMEKSKVLIQFLVFFRQFGDVFSSLYARRLRGYTATLTKIFCFFFSILTEIVVLASCVGAFSSVSQQ